MCAYFLDVLLDFGGGGAATSVDEGGGGGGGGGAPAELELPDDPRIEELKLKSLANSAFRVRTS